jgi:hypothetical protein
MTSHQIATANKALRHAIVDSEKRQGAIARSARIHQTRLSRIITGHLTANEKERKALARVLRRSQEELFPTAVSA